MRYGRIAVLSLVFAVCTAAYPSELLERYAANASPNEVMHLDAACASFLYDNYAKLLPDWEWRLNDETRDATHVHRLYALHYRGVRVDGRLLKLHYNRNGFVEYASSSWDRPYDVSGPPPGRERVRRVNGFYSSASPVIWVSPEGEARTAYEVKLADSARSLSRHYFVDVETGKELEDRRTIYFGETTLPIYKRSPDFPLENGVLKNLPDDLSALLSASLNVRRSGPFDTSKGTFDVITVPPVDYSANKAFTNDPTGYNQACAGSDCPNQQFDAVNVYYSLNGYKTRVEGLLTDLQSTVTFPTPLPVLTNYPFVSTGGGSITSNNAAYIKPCPIALKNIDQENGCLIFLKPAATNSSICGGGIKDIFNLAREASVVVHEYQHFVTDTITKLEKGVTDPNVGDALHEGYSDYFGLSHVSQDSGVETTKILAYAFKNCPAVQREIGTIFPYDKDGFAAGDFYAPGITWASGLWQLRKRLGEYQGNLLALKSQFFLPTKTGYIDAVEALVKADAALNEGVNIPFIRDLYYSQLKFLGGNDGKFADPANLVAQVGFRSCNAVGPPGDGGLTGVLAFLWLVGVLAFGRWLTRREA